MINIIYFGIGTFDKNTCTADYSIVLPRLQTGASYQFPTIFNFSKNGSSTILVHMQITGVSPDPDLQEHYREYSEIILHNETFDLSSIDYINSPNKSKLTLDSTDEVSVIIYHDDEFRIGEAIDTYYKNFPPEDKFTQPKKAGFGTLKPMRP